MAKKYRNLSGVNSTKRSNGRVREDILDALECGVSANVAASLKIRGKRSNNMLPNYKDDVFRNRGCGKNYGARPEKSKHINRRSIRENPLTEDDFYDYEPEI